MTAITAPTVALALAPMVPDTLLKGWHLDPDGLPQTLERCEDLASSIDETAWHLKALVLKHIKDTKMYRTAGYNNFKAYVDERWNISARHAYNLIRAAEVVAVLENEEVQELHRPSTVGGGFSHGNPHDWRSGHYPVSKSLEDMAQTVEKVSAKAAKAIRERIPETDRPGPVRPGKEHAEESDELLAALLRARASLATVLSAVGAPGFRHLVPLGQDIDEHLTIIEGQVTDLRHSLAYDFGVGPIDAEGIDD